MFTSMNSLSQYSCYILYQFGRLGKGHELKMLKKHLETCYLCICLAHKHFIIFDLIISFTLYGHCNRDIFVLVTLRFVSK